MAQASAKRKWFLLFAVGFAIMSLWVLLTTYQSATNSMVLTMESDRVLQTDKQDEDGTGGNVFRMDTKKQTDKPTFQPLSDVNLRHVADGLLEQMGDKWHWRWIKDRMIGNWAELVAAARSLSRKQTMSNRSLKKILVSPGVLTLLDFAHPETIKKGGPLGELVQWSDLVACLHVLGHDVILQHSLTSAAELLKPDACDGSLQLPGCCAGVDLIFTDIIGWQALPDHVRKNYKHKVRLLDSFGTEASYNDPEYAETHNTKSGYGLLGLNLKQFYTYYPHTPDNSFIGFIVSSNSLLQGEVSKRPMALLYGKRCSLFQAMTETIKLLLEYMEVESTCTSDESFTLPPGVKNHGTLPQRDFRKLIESAKLFVGTPNGDPVEGPSGVEALAKGCIVVQSKLVDQNFFGGKPTSRLPTSQNPYLDTYIGQPYVYSIDYSNQTELKATLKQAMESQVKPFIPYEFTAEGYLQRLSSFVQHQDFCENEKVHKETQLWPPKSSSQVAVAAKGQSCNDACTKRGLVCEPAHFPLVNSTFIRYRACPNPTLESEVYAPGYIDQSQRCLYQKRASLFSCAGQHKDVERLCPCRDYIKYQVALCQKCVSQNLRKLYDLEQ